MERFVDKHLELLNLERDEEISENSKQYQDVSVKELERRGICILKLRIASRFTGLYGRAIFSFEPFWPGNDLPTHKISSGDIVGIYFYQKDNKDLSKPLASGVVTKTEKNSFNVAVEANFDEIDLDDNVQYQLLKLTNEVSYRRIKNALKDLRKSNVVPATRLISVLFDKMPPSDPLNFIKDDFKFFNEHLDCSQKEAVKFALNQKEIAIVHGPPGTGKTTTIIEIILQSIKLGQKILACAPSNVAVDNLIERLTDYNVQMIRLGHPARIIQKVQPYSLDAILAGSSYGHIIKDVRKEIDLLMKTTSANKSKLYREANILYKELRSRETKATKELLERASVVLATLTSSYVDGPLKHLPKDHFDLVVIDECSQGLEAACWISLIKAPKCILAGDHLQLPPTIVSKKAAEEGLALSLMERALSIHGNKIMRMLTIQYRMHNKIMEWSSRNLYNNELKAHSSVAEHVLKDLHEVIENEDTSIPLLFIDTAGCSIYELDLVEEVSKGNEGEADIAAAHVKSLISSGVKQTEIALVTPYNLQAELLRLRLWSEFPNVEIRSVDGFQGREKEAVVMTLVRSNEKRDVGFLSEIRRLNVAITRARRHLAIICDSETISHHPQLKTLVDFLNEHAEVRSAHQYEDAIMQSTINKPSSLQFKKAEKPKIRVKSKKKTADSDTCQSERRIDAEKTGMVSKTISAPNDRERALYRKIEEEINTFLNNVETQSYTFSMTLSSYERMIVHELSEKLKLKHTSVGEDAQRYVVVTKSKSDGKSKRKKKQKRPVPLVVNESNEAKCDGSEEIVLNNDERGNSSMSDDESNDIQCTFCSCLVPKQNYDLHALRCAKSTTSDMDGLKVKRKETLQVNFKQTASNNDADDFDKMLLEFTNADRKCHFKKCKTLTATLGLSCDFCRLRFCYSHGLPEVHGCGEEARKKARKTVLKEGVVYAGSGVPSKKLNPTKRANLERKLDKKLTELANARKTKNKTE